MSRLKPTSFLATLVFVLGLVPLWAGPCDTSSGAIEDCNENAIPDGCDVARATSDDANANGHPDECEALGPELATVTTQDDVVDFGGAQRMENLPGPDGLVSFREAVTAVNNTPGPQTVAFNVPRERWEPGYGGVLLRLEQGMFVITDDETTLDFSTQDRFTPGGTVSIFGYEVNAWGVTAILVKADHCLIRGLGRVPLRGYAVTLEGSHNRIVGSNVSGPLLAAVLVKGWQTSASENVIGGTEPGEGNFLGGGLGVQIDGPASGNVVVGNRITGVALRAGATGNRIGGSTPAERNVIAGFGQYSGEGCPTGRQVAIRNADLNVLEGNYIGTTPDGMASANQIGPIGIEIIDSDHVVVRDNVISGILAEGFAHCAGDRFGTALTIQGSSTGTLVQRNRIGTDALGLAPVPNRLGVRTFFFPGSGSPIATLFADNVVAFNETDGFVVGPSTQGVSLRRNGIFGNGGLGISLSGGAGNEGQPAPHLERVTSDDVTVDFAGTLTGAPHHAFAVELFASAECDPSGAGEGQRFLDAVSVTTDALGRAAFAASTAALGLPGAVFTATATDLVTGNTSEFSTCAVAEALSCTAAPPEVEGVGFASDGATLRWLPFGPSVRYDVARGSIEELRAGAPAACLAVALDGAAYEDAALPGRSTTFYYMVRAAGDCGAGPWSAQTGLSAVCP